MTAFVKFFGLAALLHSVAAYGEKPFDVSDPLIDGSLILKAQGNLNQETDNTILTLLFLFRSPFVCAPPKRNCDIVAKECHRIPSLWLKEQEANIRSSQCQDDAYWCPKSSLPCPGISASRLVRNIKNKKWFKLVISHLFNSWTQGRHLQSIVPRTNHFLRGWNWRRIGQPSHWSHALLGFWRFFQTYLLVH